MDIYKPTNIWRHFSADRIEKCYHWCKVFTRIWEQYTGNEGPEWPGTIAYVLVKEFTSLPFSIVCPICSYWAQAYLYHLQIWIVKKKSCLSGISLCKRVKAIDSLGEEINMLASHHKSILLLGWGFDRTATLFQGNNYQVALQITLICNLE